MGLIFATPNLDLHAQQNQNLTTVIVQLRCCNSTLYDCVLLRLVSSAEVDFDLESSLDYSYTFIAVFLCY
jgi:hypothetical protein